MRSVQSELLTVQEAAHICGVSPSTFKRMCESESIALARTPGGHRRIPRIELERLSTKYMRGRGGKLSQEPLVQFTVDQVIDLLMQGNSPALAQLFLRSTTNAIDMIATLEDFLIAALWRVGELWRAKKLDIYQEHLCANTTLAALDILRQRTAMDGVEGCTAVGGSMVPNVESIPSKLVALCLQLIGYKAIDLGPLLPAESLAKAACDYDADLVWVTHTHVVDVDTLLENHQILRNHLPQKTKILIGGGGISPAIRRSLPWCQTYETLSQMAHALHLKAA